MSGLAANPPPSENKNAKRKKGKAGDAASDVVVPVSDSVTSNGHAGDAANGAEAESPYIRELHKSVRNLRKKLTNTEKASSILAENEGKSLDDLLAERKINADQKKQLENKPGVEAQLKATEEQLEHYKKFEDESAKRAAKKAEADQETLKQEHEKALQAKDQEGEKIKDDLEKQFKDRLLTLSRFLRTAAARRQAEEKYPENDAFEGVLLQLYGGDATAVDAMMNFIDGSETTVSTVEGESSGYTFKQIHELVVQQSEEMEAAELPANEAAPESDPTIVNAGLTEIEQETQSGLETTGVKVVPEAATVDADAANAAATALTSPQDLASSSNTDNWVEVRNPDETDNGLNATPAAITNQESWAEDVPTDSAIAQPANDGFSEVKHNRGGRGRGRGGRGRGEGYRGRGRGGGGGGFRGDGEHRGRGRGRGGYRGGPRGGGGAAQGGDAAPVQS